jgi:hypothetical protein
MFVGKSCLAPKQIVACPLRLLGLQSLWWLARPRGRATPPTNLRASIMPLPSPRSARHNRRLCHLPQLELKGGPPWLEL